MIFQLIAKIILLSLGLSLLVKWVGPLLPLQGHSIEVLIMVLSPCVFLGLVLYFKR